VTRSDPATHPEGDAPGGQTRLHAAPTPSGRKPPTQITPEIEIEIEDEIRRLRGEGWTRDAIAQHLNLGGAVVSRIMNTPG
jgi:hypothetical protein